MTLRLKMLQKISQVLTGNPKAVSLSMFPTVNLAWGSNNLTHIQEIIDNINMALFVLSNGKIDFDKMRQQNFTIDVSAYTSDLKGIVLLAQLVYKEILSDDGVPRKQALSPENKAQIINSIKNNNIFGTISDGGINSTLATKIGGNFKTLIINSLSYIK